MTTSLFPDKQVIKFVIGDWSSDGHGKSESFFVSSNKPLAMVEQAYKKAVKEVGVDFERICEEYDDSSIHMEPLKALKAAGLNLEDFELDEEEDGTVWLEPESYTKMLLWFIKLGDQSLVLEMLDVDFPVFAGKHGMSFGYGLFDP